MTLLLYSSRLLNGLLPFHETKVLKSPPSNSWARGFRIPPQSETKTPKNKKPKKPKKRKDHETFGAIEPEAKEERIAKILARCGICSRREAETLIREGRVTVNGKVINTPAINADPIKSKITVDGNQLVGAPRTRLWVHHKQRGVIVSHKDPGGRKTLFDLLEEKGLPSCVSVGRLDVQSEGLLLLTNNGELKRYLEHPNSGFKREYRVRISGNPSPEKLEAVRKGKVYVGEEKFLPVELTMHQTSGKHYWLNMRLMEGKNREIRKMLKQLHLPVSRLVRVGYGPYSLNKLRSGDVREVPLRGPLKKFAGVNWNAPLNEEQKVEEDKRRRDEKEGIDEDGIDEGGIDEEEEEEEDGRFEDKVGELEEKSTRSRVGGVSKPRGRKEWWARKQKLLKRKQRAQ